MDLEELKAANEQLQAQLADKTASVEALEGKVNELLTESKNAKNARRESEEAARKAAEEAARQAGDFEQLHKSSEEARQALQNQLNELTERVGKEKVTNHAMKIAGELAEGSNAELLSAFIAPRLKYTEEGVKVLSENGELTVSSVDDLKSEFSSNARYAALLKGNQSSGGGASGGQKNSGGAAKQMPRTEFEQMPAQKQAEFMRGGGSLI